MAKNIFSILHVQSHLILKNLKNPVESYGIPTLKLWLAVEDLWEY